MLKPVNGDRQLLHTSPKLGQRRLRECQQIATTLTTSGRMSFGGLAIWSDPANNASIEELPGSWHADSPLFCQSGGVTRMQCPIA